MAFSAIKDQPTAVRLLRNTILTGRIPHGLMFSGPSGVGKRLAAIEVAKAVNCATARPDACDNCHSCTKIQHNAHPDVKSVTPSGKTLEIRKAAIEYVAEMTAYRPFEGRWRVFIFEEAHRMRLEAQNHFLKTLEEPQSRTMFILETDNPGRLLPTIRSRCQLVRFGALRPETVREILLRERDLPAPLADAIAAVSQGQVSRAFELVDSERRNIVIEVARRLDAGDDPFLVSEEFATHLKTQREMIRAAAKAEFEAAESTDLTKDEREELELAQDALVASLIRRDMTEYLYLFATWYRDAVIYHETGNAEQILNRDHAERFEKLRGRNDDRKIVAIEKAYRYLERNLNMDRVLRDLFFSLAV